MNRSELARIARAMVVTNKGILAADESSGTIKKRFDGIKLESTEENREKREAEDDRLWNRVARALRGI